MKGHGCRLPGFTTSNTLCFKGGDSIATNRRGEVQCGPSKWDVKRAGEQPKQTGQICRGGSRAGVHCEITGAHISSHSVIRRAYTLWLFQDVTRLGVRKSCGSKPGGRNTWQMGRPRVLGVLESWGAQVLVYHFEWTRCCPMVRQWWGGVDYDHTEGFGGQIAQEREC